MSECLYKGDVAPKVAAANKSSSKFWDTWSKINFVYNLNATRLENLAAEFRFNKGCQEGKSGNEWENAIFHGYFKDSLYSWAGRWFLNQTKEPAQIQPSQFLTMAKEPADFPA